VSRDLNVLHKQVINWSMDRNIILGSTPTAQYLKASSEMGELADAVLKANITEAKDAIGDVLVCLINLSVMLGTDISECLEGAYDEIRYRNGIMHNGAFVKEDDPNYKRIVNG
jgi:NTP pyrophosphatase (non-canonical NTP hydrolase)